MKNANNARDCKKKEQARAFTRGCAVGVMGKTRNEESFQIVGFVTVTNSVGKNSEPISYTSYEINDRTLLEKYFYFQKIVNATKKNVVH